MIILTIVSSLAAVFFGVKWWCTSRALKGLLIYTIYKGCKPTTQELKKCLQAVRDGRLPNKKG